MKKQCLQIDVSNSKHESKENLIKIQFGKEDALQIDFSKLFIESEYLRTKYKYSEALKFIQTELNEMKKELKLSDEIMNYFIQLIKDDNIIIPVENYKDIYTISEYLIIPKITKELDDIRQNELFNDVGFTIQILLNSETSNSNYDTKLTMKIENFLSQRINECIENSKFKELQISTIVRILEKSEEDINHNSLLDFILESVSTRYILFKFISLDKMKDDKVDEIIQFIDKQDENSKKMYLNYMPFSLQLIKNMKNKYDQLLKEMSETRDKLEQEMNQTKEELKREKENHNKTKQIMNQEKEKYEQTINELKQEKINHNKTKEELNQTINELKQEKNNHNKTKEKYEQTINELKQEKINHNKTKEELNQCKSGLIQSKDKNENKQQAKTIIFAGIDINNILGNKPNNKSNKGIPIISPPLKSTIDPFSLLSFSIYHEHSVLLSSDGSLMGIGDNRNGQISSSIKKANIDHFVKFGIKDINGRQLLDPISAVCFYSGTLYMASKKKDSKKQLVICDKLINFGNPVFLDIGNHHPVALFGGCSNSAAICSEGEVIFINYNSILNSPKARIESFYLPDNEKASSVACCDNSFYVLSSKGHVFSASVTFKGVIELSEVFELKGKEIVYLSGTWEHVLAVSKEGRVFGRGSNESGRLGLSEKTKSVSSFVEISSFQGYEIRAAYAGGSHSLFETREGKIFSCGYNGHGELLLSSGPSEPVYSPTESMITEGATFCIAGRGLSIIFFDNGQPPNTPNMKIQH